MMEFESERSEADKKRSAAMSKYWEDVHRKKAVGPVDLHLTRKDALALRSMLDYAPIEAFKIRQRILNKLKREGIK